MRQLLLRRIRYLEIILHLQLTFWII